MHSFAAPSGIGGVRKGINMRELTPCTPPVGPMCRSAFSRTLEAAWNEAESSERDASVEVGSTKFAVSARAWGMHRYRLVHRNGRVGVSPSDRLPVFASGSQTAWS